MAELRPSDVFTLRIPVANRNVYANRGEAEARLERAVRRGLVPLVFGEYGVGKTSMARFFAREAESHGRLVNVVSVEGKSLADIFAACLEKVGFRVTRTVSASRDSSLSETTEAGFSTGPAPVGITLNGTREVSEALGVTISDEYVVTSPTDSKILEVCARAGITLIIDELHKASDGLRADLPGFLKSYSNAGSRFPIILLGTSSDATSLVRQDPGIDRVIMEVHLGTMSDTEASTLINTGMSELAISVPSAAVDSIVRASVGSPSIVQFLCLEIAERAVGRQSRAVEASDFPAALREFVTTRTRRLNTLYQSAIETTGATRYRKQILRAMAELPNEYVTRDQIADRMTINVGRTINGNWFSGPLRDLKSPRYGSILRDVELADGSGRVFNRTTFSDPSMKAFIRFRVIADQEGYSLGQA